MSTELSNRIVYPLDTGWEFVLGDPEGADSIAFDDCDWRAISVPHDWSVEASFSESLEGATAYLPGGIGWYRKAFLSLHTPTTYILFDGVYNNAEIYLNGERLGVHPYGYSPFYYDISDSIRAEENVLVVRVDHSRYCDSRWYTGSGIYRSVELIGAARTHIPVWGTYLTTPTITEEEATVTLEVTVRNPDPGIDLQTVIYDPDGNLVAECSSISTAQVIQTLKVLQPKLWDPDQPHIYEAVTTIVRDAEVFDTYSTPFGIRTIRFDANNDFFINGQHLLIKGVCLHHDGDCAGAAVPDDIWRRRLEKLKAAGANAVRVAHNPASEALLNLCDGMGLLVQDEFFDEWDNPKDKRKNMNEQSVDYITRGYAEHFQEWAESDLKDTMKAHRNHPCIIQWSIGNEIEWTYPRNAEATGFFNPDWSGDYFGDQPPHDIGEIQRLLSELPRGQYDIGETAQKLAKWTREMDDTRPIVANCILPSASYLSGYADGLDVIGYSYRRVMYDYGHQHYPQLPLMGAENLGQWHEWKAVKERPFVAGTFLWTGVDDMGEVNGQWPKKATNCGLLDTAGFERGSYHMMKTLWRDEPHLHLATQALAKSSYIYDAESGFVGEEDSNAWQHKLWVWHNVNTHWNYTEGEMIVVEVYSNQQTVELFLNDHSLGVKQLSGFPDRIYKWAVPFEAGILEARSTGASDCLISAGPPASISLEADGVHVIAQIVDENEQPVKTEERTIVFEVCGEGSIMGVDNGSPTSVQDFQSSHITTAQGRCLAVLSSSQGLMVTAQCDGLIGSTLTL